MYNNLICLPSGLSEKSYKKICFFLQIEQFYYIYTIFDFLMKKISLIATLFFIENNLNF